MIYGNIEHYLEEHNPPERHDSFEEWYNTVYADFQRSGHYFPPKFIEDMRTWWNNSGVDQQDKISKREIAPIAYELSASNVPSISHHNVKKYRRQVRQYNKNRRFFSPYLSQRMKKKIDSKYQVDEETKKYIIQRREENRLLRKLKSKRQKRKERRK